MAPKLCEVAHGFWPRDASQPVCYIGLTCHKQCQPNWNSGSAPRLSGASCLSTEASEVSLGRGQPC